MKRTNLMTYGAFHAPYKDLLSVQHHDITTDDQLRQYCRKLAHAKTIAFDTEFVSEHTYRPVLCLIQVEADGELAVIDPMTVGDVTPFWEAVAAPGHETIVHAGRSEVEFCLLAIDRRPAQLLDVQLAAGLAGAEYPAGLGTLISKFLGPDAAEARDAHRLAPPPAEQAASRVCPQRRPVPAAAARQDPCASSRNSAGSAGWKRRWPPGRKGSSGPCRTSGGGASRAMPGWTPADWPSSASCSIGATPRPSAAISRCAAFSATI